MAGRFQWTSYVTSVQGSTAITTDKTIVGGYGGAMTASRTLGDFRLTDSIGGTVKVRFNKKTESAGTAGGTSWINLNHPIMFDKGLTMSIGNSSDEGTIYAQVLYKRVV